MAQPRPEGLYWHAARELCAAALECRDRARSRPRPLPTSVLQHLQSELWSACEDAALHGELGVDTASHSARALLLMFEFIMDHVEHVERERDRAHEDLQSAISAMKKWRAREEMQQRKVTELKAALRTESTGASALEEEVSCLREELQRLRSELEQQARIAAATHLHASRASKGPIFPIPPSFTSDAPSETANTRQVRSESAPVRHGRGMRSVSFDEDNIKCDGGETSLSFESASIGFGDASISFDSASVFDCKLDEGDDIRMSRKSTHSNRKIRTCRASYLDGSRSICETKSCGHVDRVEDDTYCSHGLPVKIDAQGWPTWAEEDYSDLNQDQDQDSDQDHDCERNRERAQSQGILHKRAQLPSEDDEVAAAVRSRMRRILSIG